MTKTYDSYKDSGIAWIGDIPSEWNVIKNKNLLTFLYSGGTPIASEEKFYSDNGCPFVSISDMSATEYVTRTKKHLTKDGIENKNLRILQIGTILYSIYATVGAVSELRINATISQAMLALGIKKNIDKLYYKYNLKAMKDYIYSLANGNTQFNLNAEKVCNFIFCFPPLSDQHSIATFLDEKCIEIDSLISLQEEMMSELQAYKQSVITEAVTKGLNPNAKMKDSGVEWIGEIPCEWKVMKLKHISNISRGLFNHRPRNDERYYGGIYPFIQTGDVARAEKYITTYSQTLSELGISVSKLFPKGTLTMTIAANVGDVSILNFDAYIPDSVLGIVPKGNIDNMFLFYMLKAMKTELVNAAIVSTQLNLNAERVNNMSSTLPPLAEQQAIASYLDEKTAQIDSLIAIKQEKISELKDYKKSIIYEYVTGKKRV